MSVPEFVDFTQAFKGADTIIRTNDGAELYYVGYVLSAVSDVLKNMYNAPSNGKVKKRSRAVRDYRVIDLDCSLATFGLILNILDASIKNPALSHITCGNVFDVLAASSQFQITTIFTAARTFLCANYLQLDIVECINTCVAYNIRADEIYNSISKYDPVRDVLTYIDGGFAKVRVEYFGKVNAPISHLAALSHHWIKHQDRGNNQSLNRKAGALITYLADRDLARLTLQGCNLLLMITLAAQNNTIAISLRLKLSDYLVKNTAIIVDAMTGDQKMVLKGGNSDAGNRLA